MKKQLGILIMAMFLAASNAYAFRGGQGMEPGMGTNPCLVSTPDLTKDQKARMRTKQEAFQKDIGPLREKLFNTRVEVRALWSRANPDEAGIKAKQAEIQSLQSRIQERATQHQLECRQILTPEQQAKWGSTNMAQRGTMGGRGSKMHGW